MSHWHPLFYVSTLEEGEIDLQFCASLFFYVLSRREAKQPSKLVLLALSNSFLPSSFSLSTKMWSDKLTTYKIELISIKNMVNLSINLAYFIFSVRVMWWILDYTPRNFMFVGKQTYIPPHKACQIFSLATVGWTDMINFSWSLLYSRNRLSFCC